MVHTFIPNKVQELLLNETVELQQLPRAKKSCKCIGKYCLNDAINWEMNNPHGIPIQEEHCYRRMSIKVSCMHWPLDELPCRREMYEDYTQTVRAEIVSKV